MGAGLHWDSLPWPFERGMGYLLSCVESSEKSCADDVRALQQLKQVVKIHWGENAKYTPK
jgi:hypothetical protein